METKHTHNFLPSIYTLLEIIGEAIVQLYEAKFSAIWLNFTSHRALQIQLTLPYFSNSVRDIHSVIGGIKSYLDLSKS